MSELWWYVTRSSGLVAWLAATGAIGAGLVGATRRHRGAIRRRWWVDVHRGFAGLACVFAAVHVVAILADSFVDFTILDVAVPFWGGNGDFGLATGVIGLYLLAAIEVTSFAMHRLPRWAWRAVHETSYALFALGTTHAALIGTDASNPAVRALGISGIALIVVLVAVRVRALARQRRLVFARTTT
jgi:DMSO/TMAO reductase YedYZ heme-binding membrane subunit